MREINNVVVLGANGAMGAGSGEVFAAGGCKVVFLARDIEKARGGVAAAQNMAKSERIGDLMSVGTYEEAPKFITEADLIFEAVAEDLDLKKEYFTLVDKHRRPDSVVATVSSGLSISEMSRTCSESFRRHFLGIHLFNPPNVIVGTEVIPHADTDPALTSEILDLLESRFGRVAIVTDDKPAFAGNRIGFKVLNEVAILAGEHGIAFMDYVIGPYTGRAMQPLATIDLVGWDVHKAIVDNVHANTKDEAHDLFAMPRYMNDLLAKGHLGNKTPDRGGFYRRLKDGKKTTQLVLDPGTGQYAEAAEKPTAPVPFIEEMKRLNRVGRYRVSFQVFSAATGREADLAKRVVLGYIAYGLNRVGENEVVRSASDVDRIMGFGFNWAPPTVLVDLIGVKPTIALIEAERLPVPQVLVEAAARPADPLFNIPNVNVGRFFAG